MYYVYILISLKDFKLYTGFTKDLKERMGFHDSGASAATRGRLPLKMIYVEAYIDKKDAMAREKFLKSGRGREIVHKQLENTLRKYKK